MKSLLGMVLATVVFGGACTSGNDEPTTPAVDTSTTFATNAAPTNTATATATVLAPNSDPVVKAFPRGGTVDVPRGTIFFDPKTGGGEAWADVAVSPLGLFASWNGGDGKQPPVLYETATKRKIQLDTGGQFGQVLNFSPDETEVAVRVGSQVRIASTTDGTIRLRFDLGPDAFYARADWGPSQAVAVSSSRKDQKSLGLLAWSDGRTNSFPDVPDNWTRWSPDGRSILASGIEGPDGWLAIVDFASGATTRVERALLNPNWSATGGFFEGQLLSGETLVFRSDGTPVMRLNGVCALVSSPWLGEDIATWGYGEDVRVSMDGTVRPYAPAPPSGPRMELRPDGSAALVAPSTGTVLAELKPGPGIGWSGYLGFPWVTPDGRGKLLLGVGGKGACENVGAFKVELAPFPN